MTDIQLPLDMLGKSWDRLFNSRARFWMLIWRTTNAGRNAAKISTELAEVAGIDQRCKTRLLRRFEAEFLIELYEAHDGSAPLVRIHPALKQRLASRSMDGG